jgi:hypothetical protein
LDGLGFESLETRRLHASPRLVKRFTTGLFLGKIDSIILTPQYVSRFDKSDNLERYNAEQIDKKTHSFLAPLTTIAKINITPATLQI